jgi:DNA-binding response OmpR family regulator
MKQLRCMIVEDESLTVIYLEDILEKIGCTVVGSHDNGASAIEAIRTEDPDFVLLDINLKGPLDGIQVARELTRITHAKIVFITAYCDDEIKDEAKSLVPFAFLEKPFSSQKLEKVINDLDDYYSKIPSKNNHPIALGKGLFYDTIENMPVDVEGVPELKSNEQTLLRVFVENRNSILSYDQLYNIANDEKVIDKRILRVKVYTLRRKLPKLTIETITSCGYILVTP